jgi:hypothetical protein
VVSKGTALYGKALVVGVEGLRNELAAECGQRAVDILKDGGPVLPDAVIALMVLAIWRYWRIPWFMWTLCIPFCDYQLIFPFLKRNQSSIGWMARVFKIP